MTVLIAKIQLVPTNKGGRRGWIATGYRPPFKFVDTYRDGEVRLLDVEKLYPGEAAIVEIFFLDGIGEDVDFDPGVEFLITEGAHIVGSGAILNRKE